MHYGGDSGTQGESSIRIAHDPAMNFKGLSWVAATMDHFRVSKAERETDNLILMIILRGWTARNGPDSAGSCEENREICAAVVQLSFLYKCIS